MNSTMDPAQPHMAAPSAAATSAFDEKAPENWREALLTLISSRFTLIRLESRDAAKTGASRAAAAAAMVICIFFTWALLLAGGIAAISKATGWAWFWIAMLISALHLVAAIILARFARKPAPPSFPITRAEFQKDREWIENFQKTRKSNV